MTDSNLAPHRGTTILVLGILSLVCCQPIGIAAWVMGNGDLASMDRGAMDPEGRQLTQAGRICGIIGVALMVLGAVAYTLFFGVALVGGALEQL